MPEKKHRKLKIAILAAGLAVVLLVGIFGVYVSVYYKANATVQPFIENAAVSVFEADGYIACGDAQTASLGYVFYPGAKVDAVAYVPYLAMVAEKSGVFCAVVKPVFHLAILSPNAAGKVMGDYPQIERWAVGGHSLGGVVAAGFAGEHQDKVKGLVLLASYPNTDLSDTGLAVLSITATEDAVLNRDAYREAVNELPPQTQYVVVEGGNHAQFGRYGPQKGDGAATIPATEQEKIVVEQTVAFLRMLIG